MWLWTLGSWCYLQSCLKQNNFIEDVSIDYRHVANAFEQFPHVCTCLDMLCYANKHGVIVNQMRGADSLPVHGGCFSAACFARCTDTEGRAG